MPGSIRLRVLYTWYTTIRPNDRITGHGRFLETPSPQIRYLALDFEQWDIEEAVNVIERFPGVVDLTLIIDDDCCQRTFRYYDTPVVTFMDVEYQVAKKLQDIYLHNLFQEYDDFLSNLDDVNTPTTLSDLEETNSSL